MHILVVEDDPSLQRTLVLGLEAEGFAVTTAGDAASTLQAVSRRAYDLAIVDLNLPDASGFSLVSPLKEGNVLVVVLTARTDLADRIHAFELGADDYVPKPFAFAELVARIRAVSRRPYAAVLPVLQCGDLVIDLERQQVLRDDHPIDLTRREYEILHLLMRHQGQVLSRQSIVDRVWGHGEYLSASALDVYISFLRRKLEMHGPRLLHTVRGVGYVLGAHP